MKKTVLVTKKGASLPSNNWVEGQKITCHEVIANLFIERGVCKDESDTNEEPKEDDTNVVKEKPKKTKK